MKLLAVLLLSGITSFAFAIDREFWIPYPGTIFLVNGDSLRGQIFFYNIYKGGPSGNHVGFNTTYTFYDPGHPQEIEKWIDIKNIAMVKLVVEKWGNERRYVEYQNLNFKGKLWRVLKKNGQVGVYDDTAIPSSPFKFTPKNMFLVTHDNKTERISTPLSRFLKSDVTKVILNQLATKAIHFKMNKSILRKFINRRYHKSFKKSDFMSEDEMLVYIVLNG